MVVAEDRSNVDAVAEAADAESQAQTYPVGNAASEEADDRESGVYTNVGSVDIVRIDETSCSETVHSVEHARTQEANEGDKDDLKLGSGIAWNGDGPNLGPSVHPRFAQGIGVYFGGSVIAAGWGVCASSVGGCGSHLLVMSLSHCHIIRRGWSYRSRSSGIGRGVSRALKLQNRWGKPGEGGYRSSSDKRAGGEGICRGAILQ